MKRTLVPLIVLFALGTVPLEVQAQTQRPGLWETTVEGGISSASLPPDAIAKAQAAGIDISKFMGPHTMTTKVCVTPEQAKRDMTPPQMRSDYNCTMKNFSHSATSFSGEMVCDGPKFKGTGTFKGGADSDTSAHGAVDIAGTSTDSNGVSRPFELHTKFSNRWLGDDCGSVKPIAPPQG